MNGSNLPTESVGEPSSSADVESREAAPQFGAVDIVEAFTAMRHEWRGQTKESRALAERLHAAVAGIQSLESRLLAAASGRRPEDAAEARPLALVIIETDHQLSRALAAIAQWEADRRRGEEAIEQCAAAMSGLARWFARPLLAMLDARRSAREASPDDPTLEGLNMVLARLRRLMREQGLERLDVLGRPFDADTMCAIGAVATSDCPAGHVAEQLSPAYLWHGKVLRFADVRVAN